MGQVLVILFMFVFAGCGSGGKGGEEVAKGGGTQTPSETTSPPTANPSPSPNPPSSSEPPSGSTPPSSSTSPSTPPSTTTTPPPPSNSSIPQPKTPASGTVQHPPSSPPLQRGTIQVTGEINQKIDSVGNLQYFGEVVNTSSQPACFIEIYIDSKDTSGAIIRTDFDVVQGSTLLRFNSLMQSTCLNPNEVGAFDVASPLHAPPAYFSPSVYWESNDISPPKVPTSEVVVDGQITPETGSAGNLILKGSVKNVNSQYTLSQVRIAFAAIGGGKVIDTELNFVTGSDCQAGSTCLAPGASGSFSVPLAVQPAEVESYYYKINYDIMK